ncbi:hypothetical protein F4824DRAFT_307871 [Ustulina deusta]|nr:hypothetical protein F4824DRAFT_307871 [Ustulina deusta]
MIDPALVLLLLPAAAALGKNRQGCMEDRAKPPRHVEISGAGPNRSLVATYKSTMYTHVPAFPRKTQVAGGRGLYVGIYATTACSRENR